MNYAKIFSFLALSLGIVWMSIFISSAFDWGLVGAIALNVFHLWVPGLAAIIVQSWVYQEPLSRYGWSRRGFGPKWILASIFGPYALIAAAIGVVYVMGNLFHVPGFGFVVFGQGDASFGQEVTTWISNVLPFSPHLMMPQEMWILVVVLLVAGFFFGPTFGLMTSLAEELGWRGLMLEETKQLGFWGSNLLIGLLWALWFMPQFLLLNEATGSALFWEALTYMGYCIAFSFPLAYLSRKSSTIFGSAIFRGVFNIVGMVPFFFIWGEDPLVGSVSGLAGMLLFAVLTFLIWRFDPEFVNNYARLSYEETETPPA